MNTRGDDSEIRPRVRPQLSDTPPILWFVSAELGVVVDQAGLRAVVEKEARPVLAACAAFDCAVIVVGGTMPAELRGVMTHYANSVLTVAPERIAAAMTRRGLVDLVQARRSGGPKKGPAKGGTHVNA